MKRRTKQSNLQNPRAPLSPGIRIGVPPSLFLPFASVLRTRTNISQTLLTPKRWHSLAWTLMDPSASVRAAFLREVCRSLDQTSAGGGAGGAETAAAAAAAAGAAGGGAWTLRFMAYLCLAAFEVRRKVHSSIRKRAEFVV